MNMLNYEYVVLCYIMLYYVILFYTPSTCYTRYCVILCSGHGCCELQPGSAKSRHTRRNKKRFVALESFMFSSCFLNVFLAYIKLGRRFPPRQPATRLYRRVKRLPPRFFFSYLDRIPLSCFFVLEMSSWGVHNSTSYYSYYSYYVIIVITVIMILQLLQLLQFLQLPPALSSICILASLPSCVIGCCGSRVLLHAYITVRSNMFWIRKPCTSRALELEMLYCTSTHVSYLFYVWYVLRGFFSSLFRVS